MDKVHVLRVVLKKQYFWVLCVVILIASTVVWMLAVDNIETQAKENEQRIEASLQDAKQVASISQHPNDQITAGYNQQTVQLRQEVFQVWNNLYMKQRETVLKWPPALGEDFIKHVESTPFMGDIPVDFRELYFNYVKARWAELPPIIKAKAVSATSTAGSSAPSTLKGAPDYIVVWEDQENIRKNLFSVERPTIEWVWTTQEDLWIYENLLSVIKRTNAGAIGPHNAVISTIESMDVGKAAARFASGKGGGDGSDSAATASSPEGLLNGRYVDATGVPVADGTKVGTDEYKRIPVRLVLQMDAREVPLLVLNCANASLPVEIQQVKVNVDQTGSTAGKGSNIKSPELSAEDRAAGRKTPHVEVSLQGVIYIFNPPNREKLHLPAEASTGTATEAFSTEGDTGTTTPIFEDEPAAEGAPMATVPGAEAVPGTETVPAESAPALTPETPAATDPAATAPAATETAPSTDPAKPVSAADLFEDDEPAPAPANP